VLPADLEAIVDADGEGRARIEAAERAARARLDEERAAHERRRAERDERSRRRLDDELAAIRAEAEAAVVERRRRREAWIEQRRRAAEPLLARAAERWARIVLDGPGRGSGR